MAARTLGSISSDWLGPVAMVATALIIFSAAYPLVADGGLVNWPGIAVVFFGTVTVTLSTMLGRDLRALRHGAKNLLLRPSPMLTDDAASLIKIAAQCRRLDIHKLERTVERWKRFSLLYQGLKMHLDSKDPDEVMASVRQLAVTNDGWSELTISVVRRAAETAPAMGLLGTLIGLLGMLGRLSNPAEIGPAMALALLTTLYGAFLAYGVLTPLADRMERQRVMRSDQMMLEATTVRSIVRKENVRHLETTMFSLLNPNDRIGLETA